MREGGLGMPRRAALVRRDQMTGAGGYPAPAVLNYFFLAAFFLAAFFLAFFLAAIIVSFKVNLGIIYVRGFLRTPNTWCCERSECFLFVLAEKFGNSKLGAPILCHSEKKMQHLCQVFLTLE
jgi:hypothetical protein